MNDGLETAIKLLIDSNEEIKVTQNETNKTLNELLKFQVVTEERNQQRHEFEQRIGKRLDRIEERVSTLWDMVHKNSLVVNGVVAVVTALIIWFARGLIGG